MALNIHAHLPVTQLESRYRMGAGLSDAADDIWFNTTLDNGVRIACAEPDGWEGLDFLTPIDQAGGRDGGLIGPQSVAPRVIQVRGAMVSPSAAVHRQQIRLLRGKLGPRKVVVWDQHDFGENVRMGLVCRAQGDFRAITVQGNENGGVAATFSFNLVAANPPWKYGTGAPESACVGLPASEVSGRTYDRSYDWNYGATTNPGGVIYALNRGDIDSWPVIEVTGPVDMPIITNESNGGAFLISGNIPAGETVRIDSRTGIVSPSQYRLVGRPFPLSPGQNTVRWRATSGSFTPDAQLCLTWRPTWE
jgi:hypothetical protein